MTRSFSESHKIDPSDFPHLAEFARGYLHQDLIPEHGSATKAAKAYLHDLSPSNRKKAADEAFRFRGLVQNWMSSEANAAISKLGGSWNFISTDELAEVMQTLERGH